MISQFWPLVRKSYMSSQYFAEQLILRNTSQKLHLCSENLEKILGEYFILKQNFILARSNSIAKKEPRCRRLSPWEFP